MSTRSLRTDGDLAYYFHDQERRSAKEELERRPHLKKVMKTLAVWNMLWGQGGHGNNKRKTCACDAGRRKPHTYQRHATLRCVFLAYS